MTKDEGLLLIDALHERLEGLVHLNETIKELREKLEELKGATHEGVRQFVQNEYIAFYELSLKGSLGLQEELKESLARCQEKARSLND
jgi:hypothetical protein